jgi:hypothetical protein
MADPDLRTYIPEIKVPDDLDEKSFRALALFLVVYSAILISYVIATNSLHGVDEARYGIISKDMLTSGDWITPRMGTEPYFRKPPLRFWLQAPLFYFFGYSEWVIRFWSAAAAVGCILFTVQMGRMLFGSRAGLWAGFALSTCIQFLYVHGATTGEMDSLLLFFTISSLYFFLKSEEKPSHLLVGAVLMGLASLTKNLAGLIPLGIATLYLLTTGKWKTYRTYPVGFSLIVFFVLSFSWILAMLAIHQADFLKNFFVRQVYQRAISNEFDSGVDEARSWHHGLFFVARTILSGFFPWSLLLVPALILGFSQFREWRKSQQILPLLWFVTFLIGLVLFKNKFHWYILPLYPSACMLIGNYLQWSLKEDSFSLKSLLPGAILIFGLFCFIPNLQFDPFQFVDVEAEAKILMLSPGLTAGIAVALGLSILWFLLLKKFPTTARKLLVVSLIAYSLIFVILPLRYSGSKSEVHLLAEDIAMEARAPRNTLYLCNIPIITLMNANESTWSSPIIARWYFYAIPRTRVYFLSAEERVLKNLLDQGGGKIFLIPEEDYQKIRTKVPHRYVTSRNVNSRKYVVIRPV